MNSLDMVPKPKLNLEAQVLPRDRTHHREGLPRQRLAVRKNRAVVTSQHAVYDRAGLIAVDVSRVAGPYSIDDDDDVPSFTSRGWLQYRHVASTDKD